jgi:hypothetical protein
VPFVGSLSLVVVVTRQITGCDGRRLLEQVRARLISKRAHAHFAPGQSVCARLIRSEPEKRLGLNQFMAIYSKTFSAGTHVAFIKKLGITNTDMYGVAVAAIPEPASVMLALVGMCGMAAIGRRRGA